MISLFSFSNISKSLCAGLIGAFSVFGFASHSYAQSSNFLAESNFDAPPSQKGKVGGRDIGGSRIDQCTSVTIMPGHHYSSTAKSHPTFWVYVKPDLAPDQEQLEMQANLYLIPFDSESEATASDIVFDTNASLSLENLAEEDFPLISTVQATLSGSKLISLEFPQDNEGLQLDQRYRWKIKLVCDESLDNITDRANSDETDGETYGEISRVPSDGIPDTVKGYSENGIWLDTIEALVRLEKSSDEGTTILDADSAQLLREWDDYLRELDTQLSQESQFNL